jgi:CheY-like chemotaxis protein
VIAFQSSVAAWEYFASKGPVPDVVIVDLTQPGMTGGEFIQKILAHHAGVAVLATSGYPMSVQNLERPPGVRLAILAKPFTPQMLTEALECMLAGETGATV